MQSAGAILVEEQTALMLLVYIWEPDKYTETGVEPGGSHYFYEIIRSD